MKLRNAKQEIFDAPTSTGKALIAAGLASEVLPPPVPKLPPNAIWSVIHQPMLANDGEHSYPCSIYVTCKSCSGKLQTAGPNAHRTHFRHCGISEGVPLDIAREYLSALAAPSEIESTKIAARREQKQQVAPINW